MRKLALVLAAVALAGCGAPTRFALRPPVLNDHDDAPFAPAPKLDEESDYANTLDVILLRPVAHAFLFEPTHEARNVSSIDEVPDSSWFTTRTPTAEEVARGPCGDPPAPPFTVKASKSGGTTPGFRVRDARGRTYLLKLDSLPAQPEISTAADAIGARFYWMLGYNAPCNEVVYARADDFILDPRATEGLPSGGKRPLGRARVLAILGGATRGPNATLRLSASLFVDGTNVGNWRGTGTRRDDPNDVIPHEDRRELRAERLLAAWISHWDTRTPNTHDSFVATDGPRGYVRHYFLDFSDSLGAVPIRTKRPEPRMGFESVFDMTKIVPDIVTFGFLRRPWDSVVADARWPNLGYLDVAHFDPLGFAAQTPVERWNRADDSDLGWIARKVARVDVARVRAAVDVGKLSSAKERDRLVEILMGRRDAILRVMFDRSSPLGEGRLDGERMCMVDLAVVARVARPNVRYLARGAVEVSGAHVCVRMPAHVAYGAYTMLDVLRDDGVAHTRVRFHFYDLGARGWFLAGIERL